MRLAQRGGGRHPRPRRSGRPGKATWPAWVRRSLAAQGEDQAGLGPVGDGDQHRGLAVLVVMTLDEVAGQQAVRRIGGERARDSFDQAHGASGKKAPSDQTPGRVMALGQRDVGQLIIERPGEFGLEPEPHRDARRRTVGVSTIVSG